MDRRQLLKWIGLGAGAVGLPCLAAERLGCAEPLAVTATNSGTPSPLKITDIKTILTSPAGIRLVVVKVLTNEPGLYGLGCATFPQRARVVETAVTQYIRPFLIG